MRLVWLIWVWLVRARLSLGLLELARFGWAELGSFGLGQIWTDLVFLGSAGFHWLG